jgi:hypothetical protein
VWHPELVGVRVDDPVGCVLGRGQAGHACPPFALSHLAVLTEETQMTVVFVRLEDLGRAITRVVVGCEHEVDP